MAYTAADYFPADINIFQWATPTYPNPGLARPISDTATTIYFNAPPLDKDGNVITGKFMMGVRNKKGYVETIWIPGSAVAADGLSATGVVRGVRLEGLDYTTGDSSLAMAHDQDSAIFCNVSAVSFLLMRGALNGTIGSGGATWKVGRKVDEDIKIYALNSDANPPYWYYDSATNAWYFSNDGVNETPFGTGAGVTPGDGIATIVAGVIAIDLATNSGLEFSSGELQIERALIQNNSWTYGEPSGGTDDYAFDCTPAISAYAAGQMFRFKADVANTGAATLNVNSKGAKTIKKQNDQALETGDIEAGQMVEVMYDVTNDCFQMLSQVASEPVITPDSQAGTDTYSGLTSGNLDIDVTPFDSGDTVKLDIAIKLITINDDSADACAISLWELHGVLGGEYSGWYQKNTAASTTPPVAWAANDPVPVGGAWSVSQISTSGTGNTTITLSEPEWNGNNIRIPYTISKTGGTGTGLSAATVTAGVVATKLA